jgi:predicted nucleic acid-binding protein
MAIYLLDTNTVSYLADHASTFHERMQQRLSEVEEGNGIAISILTLYELTYGAFHGPSYAHLLTILESEQVVLMPLPQSGAEVFAMLKHRYRQHTGAHEKSLGRHNVDLFLASTAIAEGAVLVSNDGIFRVLAELEPRLTIENWAEAISPATG